VTELPTTPLDPDLLDDRGIADALDRAAQLIADNGLTTGEYWTGSLFATSWTPGRGCCTVGAIGVATGHRDLNDIDGRIAGFEQYSPQRHVYVPGTVHPALLALMAHRGTDDPLDVMNWSDKTTDREVVQELRACAAHLRIHADDLDLDRIAAGELVTTDSATVALSLAQQAGAVTR
jgi:hypothetical protein